MSRINLENKEAYMHFFKATALMCSGLAISACSPSIEYIASNQPEVSSNSGEVVGSSPSQKPQERIGINPNLADQKKLSSLVNKKTPTLGEMLSLEYYETDKEEQEEKEEDKLRLPAMKDTALTYGARGGLAYTSWQINKMLEDRSAYLNEVYSFNKLILRGPDGATVLPPIISEAKSAYELKDSGRSIRVADQVFEIIKQAQFTPTAPMWHTYLIREYSPPNEPNPVILPKTDREKRLWAKYIKEGWEAGEKQANDIFSSDLNKLERDYQGMIRYLSLLEEGKVSKPIIAKGDLGITGGGDSMRVNDRSIRITRDPELITNSQDWNATINYAPSESFRSKEVDKIQNFPRPVLKRY